MRLEQVRFIGFVLRNSCVKCHAAFLKRLNNVLNSNINGKYVLTEKTLKCALVVKSKNCQISLCSVYMVFSQNHVC